MTSLIEKQSKNAGRNNNGRITVRHQGGGHKQHYRIVDFRRNKDGIPAKVDYTSLPWATYTDPELAQVGATEAEARRRHGDDVRVTRLALAENDRAQAERRTAGLAKIIARGNGRILGASILAAHAGELAHVWVLAIERRLKLKHVAAMFAPYPTWGEANKMAAAEFCKPRLFGAWTRRAVRILNRLP